jgi:hypothetical protein
VTGCGSTGGLRDGGQAGRPEQFGRLLQTGAIQLGPGVGSSGWGWQGDGVALAP